MCQIQLQLVLLTCRILQIIGSCVLLLNFDLEKHLLVFCKVNSLITIKRCLVIGHKTIYFDFARLCRLTSLVFHYRCRCLKNLALRRGDTSWWTCSSIRCHQFERMERLVWACHRLTRRQHWRLTLSQQLLIEVRYRYKLLYLLLLLAIRHLGWLSLFWLQARQRWQIVSLPRLIEWCMYLRW